MITFRPAIIFAAVLAAGCSERTSSNAQAASQTVSPAAAHSATPQGGAPSGAQSVSGTVAETMNASNYTYVRVTTPSGDVWAATSQFPVNVGDKVTIPLESPMQNFHSQSLNRDFPLIYFVSGIAREGEAAPSGDPHAGVSGAQAPAVTAPIAAPAGGMTIAQVWADRAKLAGKSVTVRGKVVKYNAGIMGRNWIHIQDGSGKAGDGTNDLTLTTGDAANLGDVITASGTVTINKDFGAGYSYVVMLEQAKIAAK